MSFVPRLCHASPPSSALPNCGRIVAALFLLLFVLGLYSRPPPRAAGREWEPSCSRNQMALGEGGAAPDPAAEAPAEAALEATTTRGAEATAERPEPTRGAEATAEAAAHAQALVEPF